MRSTAASRRGRRLVFALILGYVTTTQSGCDLFALVDLLNALATPGLNSRVAVTEPTLPFQGEAPPTGTLTLTTAFPNLTFAQPLFLGAVPGTNKLFVLEQVGRVRIFDNDPNVTTSEVFLDITAQVGQGGANERGLLALAFDPNFQTNGFFYVYYTGPGAFTFNAFLDRYQRTSTNPLRATPATRCQLFSVFQPQTNHNGATLAFDRDGFLYFSLGDGGGANDTGTGHSPGGNSQDINEPLGSLLRLRPATTACGAGGVGTYSTAGNPFSNTAGNANLGGAREIFAFGLRHPWRFSFDRATGDLWIGDVGQSAREEIDFLSRAQIDNVIARRAPAPNFGWACREGGIQGPIPNTASCDTAAERIEPFFDYVAGNQATVIGGYVYRGSRIPTLFGDYVYGNYGDQAIDAIEAGTNTNRRLLSTATLGGRVWSLGEDASGELYALFGATNQVRKFTLAGGQPGAMLPPFLSGTGLFQNTAGFVLAPGIVPFEPSSKLFSDNLDKQRFIAVPTGGKIRFDATGRFEFPAKTVIMKQFNSAGRRVETRLLVRGTDQWRGYTYEWNGTQTDAVLVPEAGKTIKLLNGNSYDLPSRADCQACHNRGSSTEPLQIIGFQARQLNAGFFYAQDASFGGAGVVDNQLRALNAVGFFNVDIGGTAQYGQFPDAVDTADLSTLDNATLNRKARSYLETNCAICHRPGGGTPTPIDLQFDTPVGQTLIFGALAGEGPVNGAQLVVAPGNPTNSVLLQRMMITLPTDRGMPPISHRQVDTAGVALIREWIRRAIDANGNPKP